MLKLRQGTDILSALGGVATIEQARALFAARMDEANRAKLGGIRNEEALLKIANAIALGDPARVFVHSGSAEDRLAVRRSAVEKGEERPLAMKDHTIHFDLEQEQARIIDRTFYIVNEDDPVSSLSKKVTRQEGLEYVKRTMTGLMRGMTLFVGCYSRGPIGARGSVPALEITTSAYVTHSADLLYRCCYGSFDAEVARRGYFFTNVHSEGPNRPEDLPAARVFMDRSWLTTYAMLCTYAGNTLLLKKGNHRFAVDLATYHQVESELSEHMFITGLHGTGGRLTFIAGAAPSGCGKTTTAMVGTDFIGDDLAQLWIAEDGTLRAVNPERGIFGIVEDVNREGDPHLMKSLREEGAEVIWSNVLIDGNLVPRWVGDGDPPPAGGVNFTGQWRPGKVDAAGAPVPLSHPNSRCTLSNEGITSYNAALAEDPAGVPCRVITYSGRDSDTMPPVWVARSADEGVALGASIVSRATATEVGAAGVRRQPWANQPFIPGGLGDYMEAQFRFYNSKKLSAAGRPIIAGLNYFLTHGARGGEGPALLGEKRDVHVWLGWLERRASGEVGAIETPIGLLPRYADLAALFTSKIGKDYPRELYDRQFSLHVDNIVARIDMQREAWGREAGIPPRLFEIYDRQRAELLALKALHGPVVLPALLDPNG
jgi:phosphoenolpyruvate carboxykinase (GTP)